MSKVKSAVVGVGGIGAHHGAWMEATGAMEVVAVCDANPELATKVTENFPNASFYTDLAKMLAAEKLDFAVVASPHHLHAPLTIQCLEAGLDVLVEKPMATRYEDCLAMIETAKRTGKMLTVFHNRRLDPWFTTARDVIRSGRLGPLVELRTTQQNSPFWKSRKSWRAFKESSGGIMYDWGSHLIDYVLHFADSSVTSVAGTFYRCGKTEPDLNEDHGHIEIRFASGAVGRIVVSSVDREPKNRFTLIGEDATLIDKWNWSGGAVQIFSGDGSKDYDVEEVAYGLDKQSAPDFYANLAAHYTDRKPVMVTPESAARVIRVLNAADQSHAQGGVPVAFDE